MKDCLLLRSALFMLSSLFTPAALAVEPIEVKWRKSIASDIRNAAPALVICRNALSRAGISTDTSFKDWAYRIARSYCPSDQIGTNSSVPEFSPPSDATTVEDRTTSFVVADCPLLSIHDARKAARGERVTIVGAGCTMIFNGMK